MPEVTVRYYGLLEEPVNGFFGAINRSVSVADDPQVYVFELGGPDWVPTDAEVAAFDARVADLPRPRVVRRHMSAEQMDAVRKWMAPVAAVTKSAVRSAPKRATRPKAASRRRKK